jgi:hypothetical protein
LKKYHDLKQYKTNAITLVVFVQISFTGSTEVGREIMVSAARSNLKPVSLELGGKSPLLIFDDADVDKAAELALLGIVFNKVIFILFFKFQKSLLSRYLFMSFHALARDLYTTC